MLVSQDRHISTPRRCMVEDVLGKTSTTDNQMLHSLPSVLLRLLLATVSSALPGPIFPILRHFTL